jgi:hypothetical protein
MRFPEEAGDDVAHENDDREDVNHLQHLIHGGEPPTVERRRTQEVSGGSSIVTL